MLLETFQCCVPTQCGGQMRPPCLEWRKWGKTLLPVQSRAIVSSASTILSEKWVVQVSFYEWLRGCICLVLLKKNISVNDFSECLANVRRAFAKSPDKCNVNARRMLATVRRTFVLYSHFTCKWTFGKFGQRMFNKCMPTSNLHMHISFRRLYC